MAATASARPTDTSGLNWLGTPASGEPQPTPRVGSVAYEQPNDSADGFFTDAVAGQFYSQRIADNFTLASTSNVNGVNWWGSSEFFIFNDLTNFSSFTVEIFADAGGAPGASVTGPITASTAATNPVATGNFNFAGGIEYMQGIKFDNPVTLQGGTQYWLSIGSTNISPGDDGYIWSTSNSGDLILAGNFFDGVGFQSFANTGDVAFQIQV
ncbi:MAG: hypothetical protein VYC34_06245, partial [Planctomycetota bacterium]|nr:hypothetical protein [Planctomycetota bacterium]